ncbi:hypothetical protein DACRYDRAFT_102814 [Dacryopinax primogenitus]|uniref:Uncharacterized protein n=1 Tax=Dacryopinax primogenitus (strain DJM 731) TaxID=1858805 RepID=M5FTS2_DACPD|nr:uncharacterized protein DACRYDRAFT_102814 [Dacryopinax primogenitus]EJT96626.1 hypothetical protein DACRYDRAFT_102814 [Dacryopinax primogenitus]
MADSITLTVTTPIRTTEDSIPIIISTTTLEDQYVSGEERLDANQDRCWGDSSKGEAFVPEEILAVIKETPERFTIHGKAAQSTEELDDDGDAADTSSSSSPSTPDESLLLSPLIRRVAGPVSYAEDMFLVALSTPTPRLHNLSRAVTPRSPVPQSELSLARNIPLPLSPLIGSPQNPSDLTIAFNIPLPMSPTQELPSYELSELSVARNIPLPLSPPVINSTFPSSSPTSATILPPNLLTMATSLVSPGSSSSPLLDVVIPRMQEEAFRLFFETPMVPPAETLGTVQPSEVWIKDTPSEPLADVDQDCGETSVEIGRGTLREAFAASPGSRPVNLVQETSVDFLVPIGGDSSMSISIPHPSSMTASDISMSSLLNTAFPSTMSLNTDSMDSLEILRTPVPPSDSSHSSSDMQVPTIAQLLEQTAFTFTFPPITRTATPLPQAGQTNLPALRLSEIIRPDAFLSSPQSENPSRLPSAVPSPAPIRPPVSLADKLFGLSLPQAFSSPVKPVQPVTNRTSKAEMPEEQGFSYYIPEPPSTPRRATSTISAVQKPKLAKRAASAPGDKDGSKSDHRPDKEKKKKRKEEVKDLTQLTDKENSAPPAPRLTRSTSARSIQLSTRVASAIAATVAVSRSPLKQMDGSTGGQPISPTRTLPPKSAKPNVSAKAPSTSKLPTASKPKRSGLPVPSTIPRPTTATKLPMPSSFRNTSSLKTSMPAPTLPQRANVPVPATRVPSPARPQRGRLAESAPRMGVSPAPPLFTGVRSLAPAPPFPSFDFRSPFPTAPSPAIRNLGSPVRVVKNSTTQEVPLRRVNVNPLTETKKGPSPPTSSEVAAPPTSSSSTVSEAPPAPAATGTRAIRRMPARQAKVDSPVQNGAIRPPAAKSRVASMKKLSTQPGSRPPGLSDVELRQLTAKNTRKNEQYHSQMDLVIIYRDEPRPPSPSSRIRTVADKEKEERKTSRDERAKRRNIARGSSDTETELPEIVELPLKHMRGPGDEDDYVTPAKRRRVEAGSQASDSGEDLNDSKATKGSRRSSGAGRKRPFKAVRWDKALVVNSQRPPNCGPTQQKADGVAPDYHLDVMGNIPEAGQVPKEIEKERIKVSKYIYNDDDDADSAKTTKRSRKGE